IMGRKKGTWGELSKSIQIFFGVDPGGTLFLLEEFSRIDCCLAVSEIMEGNRIRPSGCFCRALAFCCVAPATLAEPSANPTLLATDRCGGSLDSLPQVLMKPVRPGLEHVQSALFQSLILEHRIHRPRHLGGKFAGGSNIQAYRCIRQPEDLSRKFMPGTATLRRGVVEPVGIGTAEPDQLLRKLRGRRGRDYLTVHHAHLSALFCQLQH